MERLQKILARSGIASRRRAEEIIKQGRVEVNGEVINEVGSKADPENDVIKVNGEVISKEKKVYILLYKPEGYVTTVDDPHNRKTVLDLIDNVSQRVYPVGRLDYDTSGLLLLTNDGDLTYVLTHPSFEVEKTYLVEVEGEISTQNLKKLEKGVKLKEGYTAPAKVNLLDKNSRRSIFTLTIHEGRNRQVKRMTKAVSHEVKDLKRTQFAFLTPGDLTKGEYRFLDKNEIEKLKNLKNK